MSQEITETDRRTSKAKLSPQKKPKRKKRKAGGDRGPVPPRTSGRVYLTPAAAAASLGMSKEHMNRLLLSGKLKLTKYHFYEGALTRYCEDEIEALKAGGAS